MEQSRLHDDLQSYIDILISDYPKLQVIKDSIIDGYLLLEKCYKYNHKLLIAGNGGSAADAEHIVGELMKDFMFKRTLDRKIATKLAEVGAEEGIWLSQKLCETLKAVSLNGHPSLSSACINDIDGKIVYAQSLYGLGDEKDVFLGISTSGNSTNIIYAAITAKAKGMLVIALTGNDGGELSRYADVTVVVPEKETHKIQELHMPIYHCWCQMLEKEFFNHIDI